MMENNLKREFHYFVLTDYEIEEEYLRRMHRSGYKFLKVTLPGFYYFEKCEPEDVVYKLDFNPKGQDEKQDFIQMYEDYGWEYMQDLNDYSYFRKKASEAMDEKELEIFSDNESKLDMLKRIFTSRMLPILCVFLLCIWPQVMNMFTGEYLVNGFRIGVLTLEGILFALYVYIVGRCMVGFYRLNKKYSEK